MKEIVPTSKVARQAEALNAEHKLTDLQRDLCVAVICHDGSIKEIVESKGYSLPHAYKTLQKPHVQAFMAELGQAALGTAGIRALAHAQRLMDTARSEKVRSDLALGLMDRAGLNRSVERSGVSVDVNLSFSDD